MIFMLVLCELPSVSRKWKINKLLGERRRVKLFNYLLIASPKLIITLNKKPNEIENTQQDLIP